MPLTVDRTCCNCASVNDPRLSLNDLCGVCRRHFKCQWCTVWGGKSSSGTSSLLSALSDEDIQDHPARDCTQNKPPQLSPDQESGGTSNHDRTYRLAIEPNISVSAAKVPSMEELMVNDETEDNSQRNSEDLTTGNVDEIASNGRPSEWDTYSNDGTERYSASLFSTGGSVSSRTSISAAAVPEELIQAFIASLFCTHRLTTIYDAALFEPQIGFERLRRRLHRLIRRLGASLNFEVTAGTARPIRMGAKLLQSRSLATKVAGLIVERVCRQNCSTITAELDVKLDKYDVDYDNDESEDEDTNSGSDQVNEHFTIVNEFIQHSSSYSQFLFDLVSFVHQPHHDRIVAILGRDGAEIDNSESTHSQKKSALSDITWSPPGQLKLSSKVDRSYLDDLKRWAETRCSSEWQWWPLQPPVLPLQCGLARLSWYKVSCINFLLRTVVLICQSRTDVFAIWISQKTKPRDCSRYCPLPPNFWWSRAME